MFFANDQRDTVREENPGISFGQVGKVLGDKWKALSEKQRAPYDAKAAADKKRYEEEKAKYNVSLTRNDLLSKSQLTLSRLQRMRRKALIRRPSPQSIFCQQYLKQHDYDTR